MVRLATLIFWIAPLALAEEVVELGAGGIVFRKYSVTKDGELDGPFLENHENGKPRIKARYVEGKLHGVYEEFDARGAKIRTATYLDGLLAYPSSPREVEAAVKRFSPVPEPSLFDDPPVTAAPYRAGRIAPAVLTNAIAHVQCYRFLCGLPYDDLALRESYGELAQHAAVLLEAIGRLDHNPPKAAGMSEEFYAKALAGARQSNIHMGPGSLVAAIDGFMDDSDPKNIEHVGHRRWILNPPLQFTGFGLAGRCSTLYAFDQSRADVPAYDFIPFPPRGFIPIRYISPTHAWSISLNPAKYAIADEAKLAIAVTPLDKRLRPSAGALSIEYRTLSRAPYGVPLCIIFRPSFAGGFTGQRFLVEVAQGVAKSDPAAADVRYVVEIGGR